MFSQACFQRISHARFHFLSTIKNVLLVDYSLDYGASYALPPYRISLECYAYSPWISPKYILISGKYSTDINTIYDVTIFIDTRETTAEPHHYASRLPAETSHWFWLLSSWCNTGSVRVLLCPTFLDFLSREELVAFYRYWLWYKYVASRPLPQHAWLYFLS